MHLSCRDNKESEKPFFFNNLRLSILILSISANAESNITLKIENNPTELKFQDGSKYSGDSSKCTIESTIKNCMQGKGIYTTSSGYRFTGSFINNKPEGYGELISPNGQVYKGEFKAGRLEGEGDMLYPDGRRYIGSFKENNREGQGIIATGTFNQEKIFIASEVLAKHDENYMPPNIQPLKETSS